jgi:hypothetical protein
VDDQHIDVRACSVSHRRSGYMGDKQATPEDYEALHQAADALFADLAICVGPGASMRAKSATRISAFSGTVRLMGRRR